MYMKTCLVCWPIKPKPPQEKYPKELHELHPFNVKCKVKVNFLRNLYFRFPITH